MGKRVHALPSWTLILRDGSRHSIHAAVTFEIIAGRIRVAATPIEGDPGAISRAFSEGDAIIEAPDGHRHLVSVEKFGRRWRVIG